MTAFWIILTCLVIILVTGSARHNAGRALTDITLLVGMFALLAIGNLLVGRFVDTGNIAWTIAAVIAGGFALDAIYGYMAPQRKRRRDRAVREFLQKRRA